MSKSAWFNCCRRHDAPALSDTDDDSDTNNEHIAPDTEEDDHAPWTERDFRNDKYLWDMYVELTSSGVLWFILTVLVIGYKHSGKSSFINTAMTGLRTARRSSPRVAAPQSAATHLSRKTVSAIALVFRSGSPRTRMTFLGYLQRLTLLLLVLAGTCHLQGLDVEEGLHAASGTFDPPGLRPSSFAMCNTSRLCWKATSQR